jgi:hypothetical protein
VGPLQPDPTTVAGVVGAWLTDLVARPEDMRHDDLVRPDCVVHVDGTTIDWPALRCLMAGYQATFPAHAVDVVNVAAWQDKVMIAYAVRYAPSDHIPRPHRAATFLAFDDGRIGEMWLIDDWPDWLERQLQAPRRP